MIKEKAVRSTNGFVAAPSLFVLLCLAAFGFIYAATANTIWLVIVSILLGIAVLFCTSGFFIVNPNEAAVAQLFGKYIGSEKQSGFRWMNPFTSRRRISLRIRNFESGKLKVNDSDGNPIEIAAVIVWKVVDTAEAMFNVDDYENFVHVQSEAALRNMATSYPYDAHQEGVVSLRGNTNDVAEKLKAEVQDRLAKAGVEVIEARISHLAYAPEIASAMLQRQQASAVVAARTRIVEGAVGMVEMALEELSKKDVVKLDEERKAAMVSNLLVVLCSDRHAQPVVNTGSLYQ
ncbi:MAG: SPFH domain-containing protein [Candidatus Nomurabacteria bacterium]|nr:MAG: SPFH domain-containing protein [Candidatus Nomurabacteria bacterium]